MSVSRSLRNRTTPLERVEEPYDETAMKSISTGASISRHRSAMNAKAPRRTPTRSGTDSA